MKAAPPIARFLLLGAFLAGVSHASAQFQLAPYLRDSCIVPVGLRVADVIIVGGSPIGQVYHGGTGTYVNAYLSPDPHEWVRDALACQKDETVEEIILRFTRLSLGESASGANVRAGAYADVDVLQRTGNSWLLRARVSGASIGEDKMNDNDRHGHRIMAAIGDALRAYATARVNGALLDSAFTFSGTERGTDPLEGVSSRYRIMGLAQLPKGIFRSAEDFRNGTLEPVADSSFRINGRGELHLTGELKRDRDSIWGASDGERYHVRLGRKFVPLHYDGVRFKGTVERANYSPEEQVAIGFMFGAVGMLVAMPLKERVPATLDLVSGQLLPMDEYYASAQVDHVIHFSRFADAASTLSVEHAGQPILLQRDTYCELEFPLSTAAELIRIVAPGGELELALPVGRTGSTFHLIDLDEHGVPIEKKVTEQMEQSLRARLKTAMLRPPLEP